MRASGRKRGLALLAALTMIGLAAGAAAQNARQEDPIPANPRQDFTAIDLLFRPPPPPTLTLFPQMREQMQDAPAFVRDSKASINPRSFYLDQVLSSPAKSTVK